MGRLVEDVGIVFLKCFRIFHFYETNSMVIRLNMIIIFTIKHFVEWKLYLKALKLKKGTLLIRYKG